MPFLVSESIRFEDYDSLFVILYRALADEPVVKVSYPDGLSETARSQNTARFIRSLGWKELNVAIAKVIDEKTKEICAFATTRLYEANPFMEAVGTSYHDPESKHPLKAAVECVVNTKNNRRSTFEALQQPRDYCYLQVLAIDPAWQGKGAGNLLVECGIIDKRGSRAMVEASDDAMKHRLYSRHGFRTIDTCHYRSLDEYPEHKGMYVTTMVRDARQK